MSGANGTSSSDSGSGLDFDRMALERRTERIAKNGREWWLRWDVPAEVLVQRLLLRDINERTKTATDELAAHDGIDANSPTLTADEAAVVRARMVAEWEAWRAEVLKIAHAIFAHSYPELSPSELAEHFNTNELLAVIQHFFTLPTRRSSPPPSAGSAVPSDSTAAASTTERLNRASRRAATSKRKP